MLGGLAFLLLPGSQVFTSSAALPELDSWMRVFAGQLKVVWTLQ